MVADYGEPSVPSTQFDGDGVLVAYCAFADLSSNVSIDFMID